MATMTTTSLRDIAEQFDRLPDPRCHVNRLHPLRSVIVIAILAILAGSNGPTAIARWAQVKKDLLVRGLRLPHGVPRKDVFRAVLSLLNPKVFQACFTEWLKALKLSAMDKFDIDRPVLAIDGKTNRRSHDKAKGLGALHSVSVWASQLGLSLGQVACDDKSNEITAIPELLRLIDIQGAIITIDAMGTQKEIARQVVDAKADYVLALKGNQGALHAAVIDYIGRHLDDDFAGIDARRHTVTETLHGKPETRFYTQFPVPKDLPRRDDWAGLKTIGMATRWYEKNGQQCSDVRYYISSLEMGVKLLRRRGPRPLGRREHLPLDPRHDLPRRRLAHPRPQHPRELRLAQPPGPIAPEAASQRRQHRHETPPLRLG